jgi:hypothetical protein
VLHCLHRNEYPLRHYQPPIAATAFVSFMKIYIKTCLMAPKKSEKEGASRLTQIKPLSVEFSVDDKQMPMNHHCHQHLGIKVIAILTIHKTHRSHKCIFIKLGLTWHIYFRTSSVF